MNDVESPTYEERLLASALTHEQLGEHWPEAACLFDWACPDLAGKPVVFLVVKGRLRVQLVSEYAPRTRAYWDGRCGVWVRYSTGSCQTPHAEPGRYEGESCTRAKWSTNARDFRGTRTWPCAWRLTREEALDLCERLTAHARAQRETSARADWPAEYWPTFDVLRVTEEVDQAALACCPTCTTTRTALWRSRSPWARCRVG